MKREMLKGLLKQLHEGLQNTDDLDAEARKLLQNLNSDIERALVEKEAPDDPLFAALGDKVRAAYLSFAVKHPRLEPVLRELNSMLEKIGV